MFQTTIGRGGSDGERYVGDGERYVSFPVRAAPYLTGGRPLESSSGARVRSQPIDISRGLVLLVGLERGIRNKVSPEYSPILSVHGMYVPLHIQGGWKVLARHYVLSFRFCSTKRIKVERKLEFAQLISILGLKTLLRAFSYIWALAPRASFMCACLLL